MLDVETLGAALKLAKKGEGGGGEGGSGAVIDDSKISSSTTWSSQKIVDTLCPPFTASGSVVQCTPVENSPLDVQVEITPTQEGTGDPSPENVRPIVGWDAVFIWRGGNNMLDMDEITISTVAAYGLEMEKIGNYIRIYGTSTETGICSFTIADTNQNYLCGKGFVFSWFTNESSVIFVYGLRTVSETSIAIQMKIQEGQVYDFTIQIALGVQKLTAYEPYHGNTCTVQLGQTVYGGTLDVGTGTLTVTHGEIAAYNGEALLGEWISDRDVYASGTQPSIGAQVVYALTDPQTIQIDAQNIPAISGTNTLYADSGAVTVSGYSDPIATIVSLQTRVSALESAALN